MLESNETNTKTITVVVVYHVDVKQDTGENMDNEALSKVCGTDARAAVYSGAATCNTYIPAKDILARVTYGSSK